MRSNIFDRLSFLALFLVVVLLPVFCLPFTNIPVETSKGVLLVLGLTFCIIFWAIARFIEGRIILPKSWLLVSGFGIVLVFMLSALFSGNGEVSFFGTMFDVGSFWFIFSAFVLMLMSSLIFRNREQAKIVLFGAILSSVVVLFFQSIHVFMPVVTAANPVLPWFAKIFSLGILPAKTSNILGSWNALGLFAGFATLMFLLVIEFFQISKVMKLLLQIFIVFSILLTAVVNFPLVWILLGISSLIIFVYKASITLQRSEGEDGKKQFPLVSFVVVMISLLFFLASGFIGNIIPGSLQISNNEITPSFAATMSVTKGVIINNPVFGIGPNRFKEAWSMYKPALINNTQFWDVSFDSGSGLLPTLTATTGIIGIISWLVFLVLFLIIGVKSIFLSIKNGINWEMMAFFVLSIYLFISSFFYSAGMVIFLLALSFTGVFIGLVSINSEKEISFSFLNDHRKSFFSILALIVIVMAAIAISFKYMERFVSVSYFGKAYSASTVPLAEGFINKAISLYPNDLYLRTYSQIYLLKLDALAKKGSELSEADKVDLKTSLDQVVNSALMATTYNPKNYLNFQSLGSVYQAVGGLGVKDVYAKAVKAYENASNLNPLNPGLKLSMASASFLDGKTKEAKEYANFALTLKPDYIDALILLSQIAKSEGKNTDALSYAQDALNLLPTDKSLIDYVNSLKNNSSDTSSSSVPTTKKSKN